MMCERNKLHLPALLVGFGVVGRWRIHRFTQNVRSTIQISEEGVTIERAK